MDQWGSCRSSIAAYTREAEVRPGAVAASRPCWTAPFRHAPLGSGCSCDPGRDWGCGAMSPMRVLLVDDDELFVRRAVEILGTTVDLRVVTRPEQALPESESWEPQLILLDMLPAHTDAFRLAEELRALLPGTLNGIIFLAKGPGARTRLHIHAGQ